MRSRKTYRRRPSPLGTDEASGLDGYTELVIAVLHRAIADAQQRCPPTERGALGFP
jgi:hypothetical protein